MATMIATKADLQLLKVELKADLAGVHQEIALVRKDVEILATTMTVRLGSMPMLGLGVLFAALKPTA